ncbi:HipA family kinase [Alkalimonas sp.]|uniref:HipA family kinase n=1 Tax=Alkalimonas sp. TaxID=1872453 RepID=UPI00263B7662|nr:HipA family kinase [Alkalimonas sp.]MCC5827568.1 hypothetical protein [Alkalimonas sp.]
MLEVIEIQTKAIQGRTEPYLCRLSDNQLYYIKGPQAGTRGLINEAICAWLGQKLKLTIPDYCCAYLPPDILKYDPQARRVLGDGDTVVFGSRLISGLLEVTHSNVLKLPVKFARDLFLFDYWIKNEDRTMTEHSGNPNLFYRAGSDNYVVLDHNLAFDEDYHFSRNAHLHPGYKVWFNSQQDVLWQDHYSAKLTIALQGFEQYASSLPATWLDEEPDYLQQIRRTLSQYNDDEFWEVLI